MIHPGLIGRQPNMEAVLTRRRNDIEKDYKKLSSLWLVPVVFIAVFISSFFGTESIMFEWFFRLLVLVIGTIYFVVALPLLSKEKLMSDDNAGAITNLTNMKAYYEKAKNDKWRYFVLAILFILYGFVLSIFMFPGIEQFRQGVMEAISGTFNSLQNIGIIMILLSGSYSTRKRHLEAIIDIEKKYQEIGIKY